MTDRLVVVRHGETEWNREGRMQGWAPVPLSDCGHQQAQAAGNWLADRYDIDAVHASDLRRCRETVEAMLPVLGDLTPSYETAWRERDVGIYQGLTYDTMFDRHPEFALGEEAARAADNRPESGESLVDVAARVIDRAEQLFDAGGTRLVVTHGGPTHLLLGHLKNLDVREAVFSHTVDNCGITIIEADDEGRSVVAENRTDWRERLG